MQRLRAEWSAVQRPPFLNPSCQENRVVMNAFNTPSNAKLGSIRNWLPKNLNPWKAVAFSVILAAAAYYALLFPWGEWPPSGLGEWPLWKTEPTKEANVYVLTAILVQNREEVRFWQGVLFNISLAFIGGVLGILSLALKTRVLSDWLRWTYTIAVVFLCAFYLIFVKVAENAIALNHRDLFGVEIALKLSKESEYIQGQAFYDHSEEKQKKQVGERLIKRLVPFGILLGVLTVYALLFLQIPSQQLDRDDPDSGQN
jgi:hypothetical protein